MNENETVEPKPISFLEFLGIGILSLIIGYFGAVLFTDVILGVFAAIIPGWTSSDTEFTAEIIKNLPLQLACGLPLLGLTALLLGASAMVPRRFAERERSTLQKRYAGICIFPGVVLYFPINCFFWFAMAL